MLDKLTARPHTGISRNFTTTRKDRTMTIAIVTPLHLFNAIETIKRDPSRYTPTRPLPTTPGRRKQAILAAGRDAVAQVLIRDVPYVTWNNLTKAIRRGCGAEVLFEPINKAGAQALGLEVL
jgi:hypothetical protein